ncbi:MAG: ATP-dependent DNA helicase RecG, partial [Bacteroidales bacterium]|nr:ATP-dependent DNA helicase RecG [Bacteroidales bacterium]
DLGRDGQILEYVRRIAENIIDKDPELKSDNNTILKNEIEKQSKTGFDWSSIS